MWGDTFMATAAYRYKQGIFRRSPYFLLLCILSLMLVDTILPFQQTVRAEDEGAYRFVAKWGPPDLTRDGNVQYPQGIAVDAAGTRVYVADTGNHRIQKFTSSGDFILTWGSQGAGDGQFSYPGGVAVDPAGNVYVVDTANH